jgi:hypothetical protein
MERGKRNEEQGDEAKGAHGKNSKLHHGRPSRSAFLILSLILTILPWLRRERSGGKCRKSKGKWTRTGAGGAIASLGVIWKGC